MSQKKLYLYSVRGERLAHFFFLLSHCERMRILKLLAREGDLLFQELEEGCPLSRSTFSDHIRILKQSRLILPVAIGKESGYSLNTELWSEGLAAMRQFFDKMEGHIHEEKAVLKESNLLRA